MIARLNLYVLFDFQNVFELSEFWYNVSGQGSVHTSCLIASAWFTT